MNSISSRTKLAAVGCAARGPTVIETWLALVALAGFEHRPMDGVLPLIARGLPRFELAYRSLQRHVRGLDTIFVAVPEHERAQLALPRSPSGRDSS